MNPPSFRRGGGGGGGSGSGGRHVNDVNVLNIPLVHLPLRPSSLKLLQQAGFVTSREVVQAKQQGQGSSNGSNGHGGGSLAAFAAELSNTTTLSQAASLYREVVDLASSLSSSSSSRQDENNDSNHRPAQQQQQHHHPHHKSPLAVASSTSALSLLQSHGGGGNATTSSSVEAMTLSSPPIGIVTFCRPVDQLLGGGIALQSVTEISGMPGTGKTQWGMQLAVDARLPLLVGGVAGECIYLDTEGSFAPERCYTMARALVHHVVVGQKKRQQQLLDANPLAPSLPSLPSNFTPENILQGIHVLRVHDVAAQAAALLGAIPRLLQERQAAGSPVRLIVIDSMAFHYRAAAATATSTTSSSSSVGDFMDRTRQLTRMASHLAELAMTFQVAVVALNQMTTKVVAPTVAAGDSNRSTTSMDHRHEVVPALGEAWAHAVTTRLLLVNHDDNDSHEPNTTTSSMNNNNNNKTVLRRSCHLIKSPCLAPGRAFFQVCESGIRGLEFQDRQRQHEVKQQQQQQQHASKRHRA
jgi:RAD51-like protein 2